MTISKPQDPRFGAFGIWNNNGFDKLEKQSEADRTTNIFLPLV